VSAGQPKVEPNDIYIFAREMKSWNEGTGRVFMGRGDVTVLSGTTSARGELVVAWYDNAASRRERAHVVHVYVEGDVQAKRPEGVTTGMRIYFTVVSRGKAIFNDGDGVIPLLAAAPKSASLDAARGMKSLGGVPTGRIAARPPGRPKIVAQIAHLLVQKPPEKKAPEPTTFRREGPKVVGKPASKPALFDGVHTIAPHDWTTVEIFAVDERGWDERIINETETTRVSLLTGGIDIFYQSPKTGDIEIIADRMVIWFKKVPGAGGKARLDISEAYCEGNVRLYLENKQLTCERLFYDFRKQRGLMPKAVMMAYYEKRGIPIYYRARMMKQLAPGLYSADDVVVTTSDFGKPQTYMKSDRLEIRKKKYVRTYYDILADEVKVWDETGDEAVARNNFFIAELYGHDVPLWFWPEFRIGLDRTRTALRRLRLSTNSRNGFTVLTQWNLYDLGVPENDWSQLRLLADLYSNRGAGVGTRFEYNRVDRLGEYHGELFGYYVYDTGADATQEEPEDKRKNRGRIKWVHRHKLPEVHPWLANTTMDVELSYISDSGFLLEFFEEEAKEEKEQETYIYLKRREELWALTFLARMRVNDWQLQTERLPEVAFFIPGYSFLGDLVTFTTTTEAAYLRLKEPSVASSAGTTFPYPFRREDAGRFFTMNQLRLPFSWGPFNLDAIAGLGGAVYDYDSDNSAIADSGPSRFIGLLGLRASTRFWRIYDAYNKLFDVNRLRHIIVPDVDFQYFYGAGRKRRFFPQFDEVDDIYDFARIAFGVKQRLQTKRGLRGPGGRRKSIDWMVLDLEVPVYPDADRDNEGDTVGNLEWDYLWRVSDTTQMLSDGEWNFADGRLDLASIGMSVDFSPRLTWFLGTRYIRDVDSAVFTFSADYKISERWFIQWLEQFDFDQDKGLEHRFRFRRRLKEWFVTVEFEVDESRSETSVSLLFTPVGMEHIRLRL